MCVAQALPEQVAGAIKRPGRLHPIKIGAVDGFLGNARHVLDSQTFVTESQRTPPCDGTDYT